MNILWVKDNNIGHEKQVKNLLDEISKKIDLHIDERLVKGFFPFFTYLENVEEKKYDLITVSYTHLTLPTKVRV